MKLNPQILTWARETAGYTVEDAARALDFRDTQERTAAQRLRALELGQEEPSRSVLSNMARTYHRSLLVFYLSEPPHVGDRGEDFRRAPGAATPEYDATLDALIRDIRGRQGIVKDLIEHSEGVRVDYVGSITTEVPVTELARRVEDRIGFSLGEFRGQANVDSAFAYLRERVEASGAFVLLLGNLGSYHTNIPSGAFRGYAIADPVAPFIVINDHDARLAWAFTTLHEMTHLWLGSTGISGERSDSQIESYCNRVAGEILLPERELDYLRFLRRASISETMQAISHFASTRKISRSMVAYKLLRASVIAESRWRELERHHDNERRALHERLENKPKQEGGPSYYVIKRHRVGHALLQLMRNSLAEGFITPTRAGRVLGVKPRNVDPLIYAPEMRGGR